MKPRKILENARASPANVSFGDMRKLVEAFGCRESREVIIFSFILTFQSW